MYIVVIGGGQLGFYLARGLLDEGHEVALLEKDAKTCERVSQDMSGICVRGDGCETATLEKMGTARADMFIAVTGDDEDNLIACQLAKHKFNVSHTIARVRNPKNEPLFKKLGIDVTVSSTRIILEHIEREVPSHQMAHLLTIQDKELEVVEIRVPDGSGAIGKKVGDLPLPKEAVLSLILRAGARPITPNASTVIEEQDQIIAVVPPGSEDELRTALAGS